MDSLHIHNSGEKGMKTVFIIGIALALTSAVFAQNTQPVAVYPAVTIEGGVLSLDLPQDIKAVDKENKVEIHPVKIDGGYVVVVSDSTYKDAEWNKVVKAISYKYSAEIIAYSGTVSSARVELKSKQGYTQGDSKDDRKLTSTCFVLFDELSPGEKLKDLIIWNITRAYLADL